MNSDRNDGKIGNQSGHMCLSGLVHALAWDVSCRSLGNGKDILIVHAGQLALAEATYVLVRMAQEFECITLADEVDWEEEATMTLCVKHGCNVRLTRWKNDGGIT